MPERSWSPWLWQAGFVFSGNLIAYWFCGDWCCSSRGDFCYSLTFSVLSQADCPFLLQCHHSFCWEGFPAFWSGSRACLLSISWLNVNLWLFLEPCFRPATHPGHLCAEFECSKGDLNIFVNHWAVSMAASLQTAVCVSALHLVSNWSPLCQNIIYLRSFCLCHK